MATSSLSKMGVPIASDQSAGNQSLLMPKLKYRFRVLFSGIGFSTPSTELTKQVVTAARPTQSFTPKTIDVYNSKINYLGKWTWGTAQVVIRDDATGSVSKLIGEQMQKQFDFYEQSSAASGIDYKFTMVIENLDGGNGAFEPNVLERWECYGCMINSFTYGDLNYQSDDAQQITLVIQPDNCLQTIGGANPNTDRTLGTTATGLGIK